MTRRAAAILACAFAAASVARQHAQAPPFSFRRVMLPVRDGVKLETVIVSPTNATAPLPILFRRTPYGVPSDANFTRAAPYRELVMDGYVFVVQNLRGRFGSEGTFELSSKVDLSNPKATSETTDAYDSIDWLVKNVAANNGKVGIFGVSYDGLTAAMTLLQPHPALKAVSEQASPVDQWMNDDMHRYGALRESYAFEYAVLEQADKGANTHYAFETHDTYSWYLSLGPLSNVNARYLFGRIPFWNAIVAHPDYDAFWKSEAWVDQLRGATVPNLNVAGFWDQEDPWGPWEIYRRSEQNDPNRVNVIVAGPWYHGQWHAAKAESIGPIPFGGHDTAVEFRERIEAPWFRYWLHGRGDRAPWKASTFQTGSNTWHSYPSWPPRSTPTNLYLRDDRTLSFEPPPDRGDNDRFVQYVSDPANPVPYRQRPISPTYPGGDWRTWEVADQRFVDGRPDVAVWTSAPLERDLTVTGELSAELFASTTGTDSDFVVKLIDIYPENAQAGAWNPDAGPAPGEYARSLNGYELPIAMEVRRGRYNGGYERPQPLVANQPTRFTVPLRNHDHVFLKGHRVMVQVQSTWFPLIDRNPQTFVPSIYAAKADDFVAATQRVYTSRSRASHVSLPVVSR
ncbi:MAG TPA: CocE/NonD family hydrolase [Vicinamibacterales bacterium]|nr:CocE/NonD family hydrolase [Vicinamibacterales bacterium]